jgi:hypothetical protein
MRKLIARVYDYALDGVIATEGTEFFQFCRDLPDDPAEDGLRLFEEAGTSRQLDLLSSTAFNSGLQLHYRRHRQIAA